MKIYNYLSILRLIIIFPFINSFTLSAQTQWQLLNPYPTNNNIVSMSFPSIDRGYIIDGWDLFRTDDGGVIWEKLKTNGWLGSVMFIDNERGWLSANDTLLYTENGGESWVSRYVTDGRSIRGMYWYDEYVGFAYGSRCFMLKTMDGGSTWNPINFFSSLFPGYEANIKQVKFKDNQLGYVLVIESDQSYFYRTEDGGNNWFLIDLPPQIDMMSCFDLLGPDNIWIGDGKANNSFTDTIATAWHTIDGGANWAAHDMGKVRMRPYQVLGIKFFNPFQGVAYESGHIYKTNDAGITWDDYPVSQIYESQTYRSLSIECIIDKMHCFYGGVGPLLIKTIDGGLNYENLLEGSTEHNWSVHFVDSLNGCMGSSSFNHAKISYTNDGGESWHEAVTDTIPGYAYDFDFASKEIGWFVSFQHLFKTVDGGKTWKAKKVPFPNSLYYVSAPDTGHVFMKGFHYMLKTNNSGETWTDIRIPGIDPFEDDEGPFQFTDSLTGYISYYNWDSDLSTLYKTIDGGETWLMLPTAHLSIVRSMSFADNNNGVMFDWNNGMQITKDGGYTWERINGFFAQEDVRMLDSLTIVGSSGTILFLDSGECGNFISISRDGGISFEEYLYSGFSYNSQPMTYCLNERNAFSVGNYGTIQRLSYVVPEPPIGLPESNISYDQKSLFYPNPTEGFIKIKEPGYATISIISLSGTTLYKGPLITNEVDLSMLPPGFTCSIFQIL